MKLCLDLIKINNNQNNLYMFQGKIFEERKHWYFYLVFPIVQAKRLFEVIYQFLLKTIWDELLSLKKKPNDNPLVFFIFCFISFLLYYFKDYNNLIIISSIIIWYLDYGFAKSQYLNSEKISLTLEEKPEDSYQLILTKRLLNGQFFHSEFSRNEVKQISLSIREIRGGAFEEIIAQVWQIEITLMDNYSLFFHEEMDLLSIFKQAKILAEYLQVPVIFLHSEGFNEYTQTEIIVKPSNYLPSTIKEDYNLSKNQWHIYYQWNFSNSWHLLKQIFTKSGSFLLILITNWFLLRFGFFLNIFLYAFRGNNGINPKFTPEELSNLLFKPEANLLKIIGVIFAILIMVYQGAKISQEKHIFINKDYLKFYLNHQLINQINLQAIETILMIKKPFFCIYILTSDTIIDISEFQKVQEFQTFLIKIEKALNSYLKIN